MATADILIRPPIRASSGAQTIRTSLGRRARLTRLDPIPRQYKFVVNWGNGTDFSIRRAGVKVFNNPEAIRRASNKLTTFQMLQAAGVRVPSFSTTPPTDRGKAVWLARTKLTGSCGEGISVVRKDADFPSAPLFVKYVPKTEEYRVHVAAGRVIFVQQKKRKSDAEQTADQKLIRNYDNGWVFCPVDVAVLESNLQPAIDATKAVGLDFGAVDMIIGRDDSLPYILEINTAPGLESPGLIEAYKKAFEEMAECQAKNTR